MYCQLAVSTHHTSDLEFGLLLTPTTREEVQDLHKFKKRMEKYPNGTTMPNLATQIKSMLPTPRASDWNPKWPSKNWQGKSDLNSVLNGMNGTKLALNPAYVIEMMGFPPNWTELPFLNGERNQSKQEATQ
jgi:hypothetical protein